jgi:hypothetical protein
VSSRQRWDPSIRLHLFSLSLARTLFFPYCIDFTTSPLLASLSRTLVLVSLLFAFAYFFRFFLDSFYNFFFPYSFYLSPYIMLVPAIFIGTLLPRLAFRSFSLRTNTSVLLIRRYAFAPPDDLAKLDHRFLDFFPPCFASEGSSGVGDACERSRL